MILDWLPNLAIAWGVQFTGVLSPGPGVALILGVATRYGRAPALRACLGIACGAILLSAATALGLAVIWAEATFVMTVIKILGAAYLAWLAYGAFKRAASPPPPPSATLKIAPGRDVALGFAMQMTNPKAIAYWIATVALSGIALAPWPILCLFVFTGFLISFLGHGVWAIALSSAPFRTLYARARRWVEGTLGALFAFAAFKLATER
jgi:threonine/homoserine/homoserine lactone efflux protein